MFKLPEEYRVIKGLLASKPGTRAGLFLIRKLGVGPVPLRVVASAADWEEPGVEATGWDHVSVSLPDRCPSWEHMCLVKSMFWDDEDTVMQLHPPKSEWISNHPYCLHLWRPAHAEIPRPPSIMVGVQSMGELR